MQLGTKQEQVVRARGTGRQTWTQTDIQCQQQGDTLAHDPSTGPLSAGEDAVTAPTVQTAVHLTEASMKPQGALTQQGAISDLLAYAFVLAVAIACACMTVNAVIRYQPLRMETCRTLHKTIFRTCRQVSKNDTNVFSIDQSSNKYWCPSSAIHTVLLFVLHSVVVQSNLCMNVSSIVSHSSVLWHIIHTHCTGICPPGNQQGRSSWAGCPGSQSRIPHSGNTPGKYGCHTWDQ